MIKNRPMLLLLAGTAPLLSGCVASMAASAIGMAARAAQPKVVGNEGLQPQARAACEAQAAPYGTVNIIDVEQHSIDKIIVWGTVQSASSRQSFQCDFATRVTGFKLRPIATFPEAPQAKFKRDLSRLLSRVQADPAYAGVKADADAMRATVYLKGDANRILARYVSDPRISAQSVPVSLADLTAKSAQFITWLTAHGFRGSVDGIDGRESRVSVKVFEPDRVLAAAKADGFDLTYLQINDAVPHYLPE